MSKTRSELFWGLLVFAFALVLAISALTDWRLTGERPNAWFYLTVPVVSLLGDTLGAWGTARLFREVVSPWRILAIMLGVNIWMQCAEVLEKLLYHTLWHYPGMLYLGVNLALALGLAAFGFRRYAGQRRRVAWAMSVAAFVCSLLLGGLFISLTGVQTPGS